MSTILKTSRESAILKNSDQLEESQNADNSAHANVSGDHVGAEGLNGSRSINGTEGLGNDNQTQNVCCTCKKKEYVELPKIDTKMVEKKLQEREKELRAEFQETKEKEIKELIAKFDYILECEQTRASSLLREAHRERREKISALQQQLECKNMAGLMYVMCAERTRCKIEKMEIIETYTRYINMLNDILADGQELILNLSRGYKTAARVDYEWKQKMNSIVKQFLLYMCDFSGKPLDQNQYLLNVPELLEVNAPKVDNPNEYPAEEKEWVEQKPEDWEENMEWWQKLDKDCRPFAVYGDMANFTPPQRREALTKIKATKTAPRRWQDYMFHDMFMHSDCPNAEDLKIDYLDRLPASATNWECLRTSIAMDSKFTSRRATAQSVAGTMGSIIKLIATNAAPPEPANRANLLGARDSMEIASTTKLKTKSMEANLGGSGSKQPEKLAVRRTSFFDQTFKLELVSENEESETEVKQKPAPTASSMAESTTSKLEQDDKSEGLILPKTTDSLEVIPHHVPDRDHRIYYEKTCPMERCQRKHVDSFMRSLPPYMNASPFSAFEQTFEEYETCTPEQLIILKQRIEEKKKREKGEVAVEFDPCLEWKESVEGVAVQTSDIDYMENDLPPCTCRDSVHSPPESIAGAVYRMEDLIPMKQNLDQITKECLYDQDIQFNRFKVLGQMDSKDKVNPARMQLNQIKKDFTRDRVREIQNILKEHPSLLDIFQANTRC